MQVEVSSDLRERGYGDAIRRASPLLESALGTAAESAKAVWELGRDQTGHPVIRLHLSDWMGSNVGQFDPEELSQDDRRLRWRFLELWGELLREASNRMIKRFPKPVGETE